MAISKMRTVNQILINGTVVPDFGLSCKDEKFSGKQSIQVIYFTYSCFNPFEKSTFLP